MNLTYPEARALRERAPCDLPGYPCPGYCGEAATVHAPDALCGECFARHEEAGEHDTRCACDLCGAWREVELRRAIRSDYDCDGAL